MLAANVCTADFLLENEHPALYRVHEGPTPENCTALREFLQGPRSRLGGGDKPHAQGLRESCSSAIKDRPDFQLLQTALLRSLQPGGLQPGQPRPFRARATMPTRTSPRRSGAIPTCSCIARSKRCSAGTTLRAAVDWARAGHAMLAHRAARRRRDARRRELAQVLFHAGSRRRDVRRHDQRRSRVRDLCRRSTTSTSTAWCTSPSSAATTSISTPATASLIGERTAASAIGCGSRARDGGARRPRGEQDRFRA